MNTAELEPQSPGVVSVPEAIPTPERFFTTLLGYQNTAMLKAAIDLDLFTAVGDGESKIPELARRVGGTERGVRMLCDCLVVGGFLTKFEDRYGLTQDSHMFLDKKSRAYIGDVRNFVASPMVIDGYRDLAAVVRQGRPLPEKPFEEAEHPAWVEFARNMAAFAYIPAQATAKVLGTSGKTRVLDVAAGHGMFGLAIAQQNPQAEIVALDWQPVLTVAKENATRFGLADRYTLLPGDALEVEMGTGFGVVVVANLLHHWDRASIERFLKKAHGALRPGGRIAVVEFAPNDDRVSPPLAARFALHMLALTAEGDAYTVSEHRQMLANAGFSSGRAHSLLPTPLTLLVATK